MTDYIDGMIRNLVIVPGHAVFTGIHRDHIEDETHWCLQPFQRGEVPFYLEHIRAGVRAALGASEDLLLFSGGCTRREAGERSEAASYATVASLLGLPTNKMAFDLEEFARDSFENLCFSLLLFRRRLGRLPEKVSVVGWEFKRNRFSAHAEALGLPTERFAYLGLNQPVNLDTALEGEEKALRLFAADRLGEGPDLQLKRLERDPFSRGSPYGIEEISRIAADLHGS